MPLPPEHPPNAAFGRALALVDQVCTEAAPPELIGSTRAWLARAGVVEAARRHDDAPLLDWLLEMIGFQGIADAVASRYVDQHGKPSASATASDLAASPSCPKLACHWSFVGCGYRKGASTCAEPDHMPGCSLPRLDLRNGRLNQSAFALVLFARDVAGGDLVGWIDRQLAEASETGGGEGDRSARLRQALLHPLRHVHGVGNKVLSMALSDLLLGAGEGRPLWVETGAHLIAVDTLVHNWLHRTGILGRLGRDHPYGPSCYGEGGCAELIERFARAIDARRFNPAYPAVFPRPAQRAVWAFCAGQELSICNGNRIDDRARCTECACPSFDRCERVPLHASAHTPARAGVRTWS